MKNTLLIVDLNETNNLARKIASELNPEVFLLLSGNLGAGKTTFTKALLKAIGVKENVTSPTFNILNQYKINNLTINHMDAYRLDENSDLEMFVEQFDDSINIIEWWENISLDISNQKWIKINININEKNAREFTIERN